MFRYVLKLFAIFATAIAVVQVANAGPEDHVSIQDFKELGFLVELSISCDMPLTYEAQLSAQVMETVAERVPEFISALADGAVEQRRVENQHSCEAARQIVEQNGNGDAFAESLDDWVQRMNE